MSDERNDADAAADGGGTDDTQGGRTAVVTRPQRPSGKRSRHRADDADSSGAVELTDSDADDATGKKAKKAKKAKASGKAGEESTNPIVFVITYLRQVVAELRKVIWPNRKQMGTYTSVVLAFLVFMVTLISVVDLGLAKLVLLVFG
ncbi:preprotein translocase subunit SecE [Mycobacterium cookii]|uniref:Protein translocase subunit SecE n=1 Tax=Mycobacterium cookii TaxID=1775 RepID=A0A7I7L217_9MYCO|nr:preprotein translocase subunit SecE [Mycobacterium cookii]MCV7333172.1 preprotein translocase subunit SecE [Mycobacterium cookii]BBX48114.1 protein translocase subunit SecE [Mycobacterium cookii]